MKLRSIFLLGSLSLAFQTVYAEPDNNQTSNLPEAERTQTSNATSATPEDPATINTAAPSSETQSANVEPGMEQAGFSQGSVIRSAFTSEISDREPIDTLNEISNDSKVYFFTELRDMSGQTAIHRWEHEGEVKAEVEFKVGGPRWRVWSSKSFNPEWTGEWKVSVVNGANQVINEKTLMLTSQSNATAAAENNGTANQSSIENQIVESETLQ